MKSILYWKTFSTKGLSHADPNNCIAENCILLKWVTMSMTLACKPQSLTLYFLLPLLWSGYLPTITTYAFFVMYDQSKLSQSSLMVLNISTAAAIIVIEERRIGCCRYRLLVAPPLFKLEECKLRWGLWKYRFIWAQRTSMSQSWCIALGKGADRVSVANIRSSKTMTPLIGLWTANTCSACCKMAFECAGTEPSLDHFRPIAVHCGTLSIIGRIEFSLPWRSWLFVAGEPLRFVFHSGLETIEKRAYILYILQNLHWKKSLAAMSPCEKCIYRSTKKLWKIKSLKARLHERCHFKRFNCNSNCCAWHCSSLVDILFARRSIRTLSQ